VTIIINNTIVKTTTDLPHQTVVTASNTRVTMITELHIIQDTIMNSYNDLGGYMQSYNRGGPPRRGMQPYRGAPRDNQGGYRSRQLSITYPGYTDNGRRSNNGCRNCSSETQCPPGQCFATDKTCYRCLMYIKYIHNFNILNKNINVHNSGNKQKDARNQNSNAYANTRRHSHANTAHHSQNDARHSYGNDARHSYGNDARQNNMNRTQEQVLPIQPKEKVNKTIHHKYKSLNL